MIWGTEGRHLWVPPGLAAMYTPAQLHAGTYATNLYDYIRSLTPSLYWPLNAAHGVTDQSGNGRNGTPVGGVTIGGAASTTEDPTDSATLFDGVDDYITSTYAPFVAGSTRTFFMVVSPSPSGVIFSGSGSTPPRLEAVTATSWIFRALASGVLVSWSVTPSGDMILTFNETANTTELFERGVSRGIQALTNNYTGPGNFELGRYQFGTYFAGRMAHVAVFERALTAAEIAGLHFMASTYPVPVPVTLNRRTDDSGNPVFPRYKVRRIGGLSGGGESGDTRDSRVGAQGEIPRRSYRRGKTITYEGQVQAQTRAALRTAEQQLNDAFDDQSADGLMVVAPHPLYDTSGAYRYFNARAIACEIDDPPPSSPGRVTLGHESPFVIAVRNARSGGVSYRDQAGVTYK